MSDDRANRLRERRNKSATPDQPDNPDKKKNPAKPAKPNKVEKADNLENPGKTDSSDNEPTPVKQRGDWRALQIQLPNDLRDELELLLDETNLKLKRDGEDGLEKFMHFYPLLVTAGLERIEEMDVDERRRRAKEFE